MKDDYVKTLVISRLKTIPPNVSFSIGAFGDFSRNDLIEQVRKGTDVGKSVMDSEINFLRELPRLSGRLHEFKTKTAASH